jgi:anti-sigma B factor antagonist
MNSAAAGPDDEVEVLDVQGELDMATADSLQLVASQAIAGHPRVLLLDLAGLSFCDASGLNAFVRIAKAAGAAGCGYGLIAPRPQVAKILRVTGLDAWLPVFATVGEALSDSVLAALPEVPRPAAATARQSRPGADYLHRPGSARGHDRRAQRKTA